MNSSAALKAFCGRNGGIVCTVLERGDRARVGVRARPAGAVLPRPAPRPQHREGDGRSARADADVEPAQAARRQHRAGCRGRPGHPLARVLQRAQALHRRPDRAGARRAPRRARDRAPGVPDAGGRRRRRGRLDRLHPQGRRGRDRADDLRDRHRDQHGQPAGRGVPAAHDLLPRPGDLPVLDDVPHPPRLPRLGARGARARRGPQPDHACPRRSPRPPASPSSACSRRSRPDHGRRRHRRHRHRRAHRRASRGDAARRHARHQGRRSKTATPGTPRAASRRRCSPTTASRCHVADTLPRGGRAARSRQAVDILCSEGPRPHPRPDRPRRRVRPRRRRRSWPAGSRPRTSAPRAARRGRRDRPRHRRPPCAAAVRALADPGAGAHHA